MNEPLRAPRQWRMAIDVGGTFTDLAAFNEETHEVRTCKVSSTPDDPLVSVKNGLSTLGIPFAAIRLITHSTTITTNALITRRFPSAAMVTTEGFRDIIEIRDGTQQDVWDAYTSVAPPYIARRNRFEVIERIDSQGRVLQPLDVDAAIRVAERIVVSGVKTVAVCFINAYANSSHEDQMAQIIHDIDPLMRVCTSALTLPEVNEYERFSTTVANALLGSLVAEYIGQLEEYLQTSGYSGDLLLMHSGGGTMTSALAREFPLRLAASSIAGGAMAARFIARQCGYADAISMDMGGTSTDITLIDNGQVRVTGKWSVEYGHPICFPGVELATIGAGGGTVARVDESGALRSGPQSAGSHPGPAAYSQGGIEPTNTDANLLLGRLGRTLASGAVELDEDAARDAIRERVANPLGISDQDAASAIIDIADAATSDAVRLLRQGRRTLSASAPLIVFGGAGPMHGVAVAEDLGIPLVIVPPSPGTTSALGCLLVDLRHDFTTMYQGIASDLDPVALERRFEELESQARHRLTVEGVESNAMVMERAVHMRYRGQWRSLVLPFGKGRDALRTAIANFRHEYRQQFNYLDDAVPVELYQLALTAIGRLPEVRFTEYPERKSRPSPTGSRLARFSRHEGFREVPVFERRRLTTGMTIRGPGIIDQADATTVIPPEYQAVVDSWLNLHISKVGAA